MTVLKVNGRNVEISDRGDRTLADALRTDLGLIGARVSCSEGECGSCTILVDGLPQTSCLMLAQQAEGKNIMTIEGLADGENLHPIQQAFIEEQGFQCGFCTPGFILSAKAFLEENPNPTADEVSIGMSGNICRCGAYPYIVKAVLRAAELMNASAQAAE
ncbi:Carbon monoxide dehydrogenase small chain [Falsiruegeria litorea R37]|uniref:Carbon monoxide dehydrogenase small chain n=1 Tax=Falsiruegeria litorea R37 TaxID=1200284 RepID=A0A1Y5TW65_9RHOB|nr:(2Fe-2S)-binding protein [Falsiruegeria litorea]SLN71730.1 Carbon monoxide dehydrogenase small chain [Falsiruegeria litorea R37]